MVFPGYCAFSRNQVFHGMPEVYQRNPGGIALAMLNIPTNRWLFLALFIYNGSCFTEGFGFNNRLIGK